MEQRSPEWFASRLGKVTASMVTTVASKSVARKKYLNQLITERLTGRAVPVYVNQAMQHEIKCPQLLTHTEVLATQDINIKYQHQMQWQLACMPERKWCDFVSYHPDFPDEHKLLILRVDRDDELINSLEVEVKKFLNEVDEALNFINNKEK